MPVVCGGLVGFKQQENCYEFRDGEWQVATMSMIDRPRFDAPSWRSNQNWFVQGGSANDAVSVREMTMDQNQLEEEATFREYRIESGLDTDGGVAGQALVRFFNPSGELLVRNDIK